MLNLKVKIHFYVVLNKKINEEKTNKKKANVTNSGRVKLQTERTKRIKEGYLILTSMVISPRKHSSYNLLCN